MLDQYLRELGVTKDRHVSMTEMAKTAGVNVPEGTCPECGDAMQKEGTLMKCACGMLKKASIGPLVGGAIGALGAGALLAGAMSRSGREQINSEVRDPRLYSNLRGMVSFESPEDRTQVHARLGRGDGSVLDAARIGLLRKEAASGGILGRVVQQKFVDRESEKSMQRSKDSTHVGVYAPGVLPAGHTHEGMRVELLPNLNITPTVGIGRAGFQLGMRIRKNSEAFAAGGAVSKGVHDMGEGPNGLTYEVENKELAVAPKKAPKQDFLMGHDKLNAR